MTNKTNLKAGLSYLFNEEFDVPECFDDFHYEESKSFEENDYAARVYAETCKVLKDFRLAYKLEPEVINYSKEGYVYFKAGNELFPTYFRGFVRGEFTYIDPFTEKTNEIKDGKFTHREVKFSEVF